MTMPARPPISTAGPLLRQDARERGGLAIERGHVLSWRSTVDGNVSLFVPAPGRAPEWVPAHGAVRPSVR